MSYRGHPANTWGESQGKNNGCPETRGEMEHVPHLPQDFPFFIAELFSPAALGSIQGIYVPLAT